MTSTTKSLNIVIVSPALADSNNGNWQTAKRYARILSARYSVKIVSHWDGDPHDDVMIALHARRSHAALVDWYTARGSRGLVLVLTGTDVYRDIQFDAQAQQSLLLAQQLVVLQPAALDELPTDLRSKTAVLFQSTSSRVCVKKSAKSLSVVMVGHLRPEKSPQTLFKTAALIGADDQIRLRHIGGAHDHALAAQAYETATAYSCYQFLGELSHLQTRRAIQRAHLLVHTSIIEGGAHVVMEAICSGVPVIASDIPGNRGMLGDQYSGLFPVGDAHALYALLKRARHEPEFLLTLAAQCAQRRGLFSIDRESKGLTTIIHRSLSSTSLFSSLQRTT